MIIPLKCRYLPPTPTPPKKSCALKKKKKSFTALYTNIDVLNISKRAITVPANSAEDNSQTETSKLMSVNPLLNAD